MNAFEAVVGNPPYQVEKVDGNGSLAVYQEFMLTAQGFGQHVTLVYPARWLSSGRGVGMEDFRATELNSRGYVKFVLDPRHAFFENIETKGGVCYFLWERDRGETKTKAKIRDGHEPTETVYVHGADEPEARSTLLNNKPVFIRETRFSKISDKIGAVEYLKSAGGQHYGKWLGPLRILTRLASEVNADTETVTIYYAARGGQGVKTKVIPKSSSRVDTGGHKVFVSATADPQGNSLRRPGRIFTARPHEICSSSFIVFNHLNSVVETERLVKYLKTDFATFLLGMITPTQHAYGKVYKLIPDVDFATGRIVDNNVVIDFNGSGDDIDDQLATIYGLTDEERELMAGSIKPWKDKNSLTADGLY